MEDVDAAIAQRNGQVEVLLVAGDAVQKQHGREAFVAAGAVERAEQAATSGAKHQSVERCRGGHERIPRARANSPMACW
jgi:hypothetical protein